MADSYLMVNGPTGRVKVKLVDNADGTYSIATTAEITAELSGLETKVGIVTETAPATDTASSGLNGRLQRIAQRITSLIALFKNEDDAHVSGDGGIMALAVRKNTAVALAGADGDYIPLIVDTNGALHCNVATLLAGEDQTYNRLMTMPVYNKTRIAAGQATTVIKASAGVLHAIIFDGPATATNVTNIYDHPSGVGTVIQTPLATGFTKPEVLIYNCAFDNGLTIITGTANGAGMTVIWK